MPPASWSGGCGGAAEVVTSGTLAGWKPALPVLAKAR